MPRFNHHDGNTPRSQIQRQGETDRAGSDNEDTRPTAFPVHIGSLMMHGSLGDPERETP
jgi:hypothetical protein